MKKMVASSSFRNKENSFFRIFKHKVFLFTLSLFVIGFFFILLLSINIISSQEYELKVTEEHPFLVNGKWLVASELKAGDLLTTADGKKARITEIEDIGLKDSINVYNLESLEFNDFVVDGSIIVHNSNQYPLFETRWEESGLLRKETIYIDDIPSDLAEKIRIEYDSSIGRNYNSIEELNEAAIKFSKSMYESLPFLGYDSIQKLLDARVSHKFLFEQYLKLAECAVPKLSKLIRLKQLDCTGQGLTIRQALGGKESGWKVYHALSPNGKKRVHTFLAKEIEIFGKKYMIMIDPVEVNLYKGVAQDLDSICPDYVKKHTMVMKKDDFLKIGYPEATIK